MTAWFIDKVLPGLIVGAVMSAGTWLSHRRLKRQMTGLTTRQTLHIDKLTAEQTADLKGRRP
jgi:hypothetical protein